MSKNTAFDISSELRTAEKVEDIHAALQARRKKNLQPQSPEGKASTSAVETVKHESSPVGATEQEAERKMKAKELAERKKAEASRKKEEEERLAREKQAQESRWITPSFKIRESRARKLDQIYFAMKSNGSFIGTKQEFYDEGLTFLEEKYRQQLSK